MLPEDHKRNLINSRKVLFFSKINFLKRQKVILLKIKIY